MQSISFVLNVRESETINISLWCRFLSRQADGGADEYPDSEYGADLRAGHGNF